MGQILRLDKLGLLSLSLNTITLGQSRVTVGGRQYSFDSLNVTLSGLSAGTLYMLYVVVSGGVPSLIFSTSPNSTGPVGFTAWKLVGAFYSNGATTPAFGSFIRNLASPIKTANMDLGTHLTVGPLNTLVLTRSENIFARDGKKLFVRGDYLFGAGTGTASGLLTTFPFGLVGGGVNSSQNLGVWHGFKLAQNHWIGAGFTRFASSTQVSMFNFSDFISGSNRDVFSSDFTNGDIMRFDFSVEIDGWNDVPVQDM